jgi:hypothetical protein
MPRTSTHPVAVVVFVKAEGADAHDAANVAELGIAALFAERGNRITVKTRAGERAIDLGQVAEVGRAGGNGELRIAAAGHVFPR